MNKVCKRCGLEKSLDEFRNNRNQCKQCETEMRNKYTCICTICGKSFKSQKPNTKFCSKDCNGINRRNRVKCKCDYCNKDIEVVKYQYDNHKLHFCNLDCANSYQKENPIIGENSPKFNREIVGCSCCGNDILLNQYRIERTEYHYCSKECQNKHYQEIFAGKNNPMYGKIRPEVAGENNWNWNPNITDEEREFQRNTKENDRFKREVRERDNYTCVCCGKRGGNNVVHHINSWNWDKENRYNPLNAVVLCDSCHKEYHSIYGYGDNTMLQFFQFMATKKIFTHYQDSVTINEKWIKELEL